MTNTEMLARMRTMLDEATTVLYNDTTELYPALSLAQLDISRVVANAWHERQGVPLPRAIQFLTTVTNPTIASGTYEATISGNIIQIISVQWNPSGAVILATTPYAIELGWDVMSRKIQLSSLLSDGLYYTNVNGLITMNPVSTSNSAEIRIAYLDSPEDITASVQPELRDVAHDAIIERALWILLKDRETEQAQLHLQLYGSLLEGLMK